MIEPETVWYLDDHDLICGTLAEEDPDLNTRWAMGCGSDELTAYLENEDLSLEHLIEEL